MNKKTLLKSILICLVFLGSLMFPPQVSAAVPAAPTNLVVSASGATSIALSWHDNSSDEMHFFVYRRTELTAFALIDQLEPNHTYYGDSGLQPGTKYYYVIKAYNSSGLSASSNTASATTPNAVVHVTAPNGGEEWLALAERNITWTSNGEGFQARLRYRVGSSAWVDIATVPNTNSYTWTVPNVDSSQVRVSVSLLLDGETVCVDQSDANFTIDPLILVIPSPAAPTDLSCSYINPDVVLNWTDNADNEIGFKIERKAEGGAYAQIGTTGANITSFHDPNTEIGGIYSYRVCAYKNAGLFGNSAYSNEVTMERTVQYVSPITPDDLTASPQSSSAIRLDWNAGLGDGVEIERRTGSTSFAKIGEVGITTKHFNDGGLQENTSYKYRVRAYTEELGGSRIYSEYSDEVTATTLQASSPTGQTVLRFTIDSTEYYVKTPADTTARLLTMDTAPITSGGRTLLPIRYVADPLGADVGWDGLLDQVTVQMGDQNIVLWINNSTARVNGAAVLIDPANPAVTPITVPPGRTLLPLRFIAENLGCDVAWNAETSEVTVTYPKI